VRIYSDEDLEWTYRNKNFKLNDFDNRVVNYKFGPPKELARALNKLDQGNELKDLNRVMLEFDDPRIMELAYYCIVHNFNIVAVKNKHNNETKHNEPPVIHINVAQEDGWIFEIQMVLKLILLIKKEQHFFYDLTRADAPLAVAKPLFHKVGALREAKDKDELIAILVKENRERKIENIELRSDNISLRAKLKMRENRRKTDF